MAKKLPPGKKKKVVAGVTKAAPFLSISFLDGFLMAQTLLGRSREQALALWREQFGEGFGELLDEYANFKVDFSEGIFFSEEFVLSMAQLENWMTGLGYVLLRDEGFQGQVDRLVGSEAGRMAVGLVTIMEGFMHFGPLNFPPDHDPKSREVLPVFRQSREQFLAEMRRYGLRKRLDYLGGILGLLEGIAQGKVSPD